MTNRRTPTDRELLFRLEDRSKLIADDLKVIKKSVQEHNDNFIKIEAVAEHNESRSKKIFRRYTAVIAFIGMATTALIEVIKTWKH